MAQPLSPRPWSTTRSPPRARRRSGRPSPRRPRPISASPTHQAWPSPASSSPRMLMLRFGSPTGEPGRCGVQRDCGARLGQHRSTGQQAGDGGQERFVQALRRHRVLDLEIDATEPADVIRFCEMLAPTVGGINLEDIKAPECFEVSRPCAIGSTSLCSTTIGRDRHHRWGGFPQRSRTDRAGHLTGEGGVRRSRSRWHRFGEVLHRARHEP